MNHVFCKVYFGVIMLVFFAAHTAFSATIYVDNTLRGDITNGSYSIENRDDSGSDGNAYRKIQTALDFMSIGDTILIRGGVYKEDNGHSTVDIMISPSKNGDSWEPGHFNTLASYPGEWAIIDGEGNAPKGVVLGYKGMSAYSEELKYWKFERLGITGGASPGDDNQGGAGLWVAGGPVVIRYCNFYENWDNSQLNNPSGLTTYRLRDSIIEYNRFFHNGCASGSNCAHVANYSDYKTSFASVDVNHAVVKNEWRYNYFEDGYYGLKNKAIQLLSETGGGGGMDYKDYGDKIHHNIFVNFSKAGVMSNQDFQQVYNNIFDNSPISNGEYNASFRFRLCYYNNTLINTYFVEWGQSEGGVRDSFYPNDFIYNNIFDRPPTGNNETRPINIGAYSDTPVDVSNFFVENNYWYLADSPTQILYLAAHKSDYSSKLGLFSVSEFNSEYGFKNYSKNSEDLLFQGSAGANKYITIADHSVGSATVGTGGRGGSHPYLAGVTIPSYLGATNPTDNAWVAGVLNNVTSTAWLRSQGAGYPSWIEGNCQISLEEPQSPPSRVQNVILTATQQ